MPTMLYVPCCTQNDEDKERLRKVDVRIGGNNNKQSACLTQVFYKYDSKVGHLYVYFVE